MDIGTVKPGITITIEYAITHQHMFLENLLSKFMVIIETLNKVSKKLIDVSKPLIMLNLFNLLLTINLITVKINLIKPTINTKLKNHKFYQHSTLKFLTIKVRSDPANKPLTKINLI